MMLARPILAKLKWQDGFVCMNVDIQKVVKNLDINTMLWVPTCWRVQTANHVFHKLNLDCKKAFCTYLKMSTSSKSVSSIKMGKRLIFGQGTAFGYFMQKVRKAMKSSQKLSLSAGVDTCWWFTVGGKETGPKQGRATIQKRKRCY